MKKIAFTLFGFTACLSLFSCNELPVSKLPPRDNGAVSLLTGSGLTADPSSPTQNDAEELQMLALINQHRVEYGLTPLKLSAALTQSSRWLSSDMAAKNYFDHTDSLGRSCFARMDAFNPGGSQTQGENIACGNVSASATYQQWLYSPGHNSNMLGDQYTLIGIGRAYGGSSAYGWYWTTDFSRAGGLIRKTR